MSTDSSSDNHSSDRPEAQESTQANGGLVAIGGKLPFSFQVKTSKLLDVLLAFSPRSRGLKGKRLKKFRQELNQKLYIKTRPGFYFEISEHLHFSYVGQPGGANTQHQWAVHCDESLKPQIETILAGTALVATTSPTQATGDYQREWGGLYLRSEAEVRIAEALDKTGILFFANARGRVGLHHTLVSDRQLTGRVEADFMVFHDGRCLILEVDGQHHEADEQIVRDYARDRVLLRSGVPTVRFVARDCLERPQEVVAEVLSILTRQ